MPGNNCTIAGCQANGIRSRSLSFFSIRRPGNVEWERSLVHSINRVARRAFNKDTSKICSRHFLEKCFTSVETKTGKGLKRILIPGSIPTEHMPTIYLPIESSMHPEGQPQEEMNVSLPSEHIPTVVMPLESSIHPERQPQVCSGNLDPLYNIDNCIPEDCRELSLTSKVTLELLAPFLNKGLSFKLFIDNWYNSVPLEMVANILQQTLDIATMDDVLKNVIKEEREENVEEFNEKHQYENPWNFEQSPEISTIDRQKINFTDELRIVIKKEKEEMDEVVNRNQRDVDVQKTDTAANIQKYMSTKEVRNKNKQNQKNVSHIKDHFDCIGVKQFYCELSEKIFSNKLSLQQHQLVHNNARKSTFKGNLKRHLARHAGEKPFQCQICQKGFAQRGSLKRHLARHSGEKPFKCQICQKGFAESINLKRHLTTHTGEKKYKCPICQKCFAQLSTLIKHLATHTGEKKFQCLICHNQYSRSSTLKRHLATHTGEKPFKCQTCHKQFSRSSLLKLHLAIHAGEKTIKCEMCQKRFLQKGELKLHLLGHTGEKPFKCEMCQKGFLQKGELKLHLLGHSGEKPFKCEMCQKSFGQKGELKLHLFGHTGEKPFKCEMCQKGFLLKRLLKQHLIVHIGKKQFHCKKKQNTLF